jgi:multiple sugar transport system ATP-binding protein
MARVDLENITKVYPGGVRAVDSVDLAVRDQEFVVLVGPSGCGKSTTLRMVAGLEDITDGVIRIGERVVNDVPPKDRDIAMVFQNYALYPHMTVYKNLEFGLKMRGVPRPERRQRVLEAAKTLDIEHLLERKPKALSGGQRQRVAVGRAIVREPAAFLFDEPLSNLDAKLRVTTRAELKRLHQRLKTTTLYVTHDQEEAMTLGDRIVVMKDGRIQQADAPLTTYNYPVNRFVAGFIGMPPMNFFDGLLRQANGGLIFEERRGSELTPVGNGFTLALSHLGRTVVDRLGEWVGRPVVLGVRPEHSHLEPVRGSEGEVSAPVLVKVTVIEPLGSNMDVYMQTHLHEQVVGRVEARPDLKVDTTATFHVDLRKIHLFEPGESGMNLSLEKLSPATEPDHAMA